MDCLVAPDQRQKRCHFGAAIADALGNRVRLIRRLDASLIVHSAHIATYGERAVDNFYVTDVLGEKVDAVSRLKAVEVAA